MQCSPQAVPLLLNTTTVRSVDDGLLRTIDAMASPSSSPSMNIDSLKDAVLAAEAIVKVKK